METVQLIQTTANVATALTFGVLTWQLFESNKQTRKSAIQKRSEYIIDLYNTFVNDNSMVDAYYDIEYDNFVYCASEKFQHFDFYWDPNFHGSITEKRIDKLLGHFSNIGRIYEHGILSDDDLQFFKYEFLMIYQNENIQSYLTFLDNWTRIREIEDVKFAFFRTVAKKLEANIEI